LVITSKGNKNGKAPTQGLWALAYKPQDFFLIIFEMQVCYFAHNRKEIVKK